MFGGIRSIKSAMKRQLSTTRSGTSKKPKLDASSKLYKRQWEDVCKVDQDSPDWFRFTVASYNVLSQNLLDTNKHLYQKCHPKHLAWQHRKSVIRDELAHHQPDVICLQEVHCKEFSQFFLPELQKLGYFGLYKKRTSEKEDGCATFFKHEKFVCVASKPMEFRRKNVEVLNRDNVGLLLLLRPVVARKTSKKRKDAAEIQRESLFKKLEEFRVCIANTHLLFNPKRGDVKLAQMMTLMAGVDELTGGMKHGVVVCGDLNAEPRSGLYEFLVGGRLACRDMVTKFFSGQMKPGRGDSAHYSGWDDSSLPSSCSTLPPNFLEKMETLTDQCQFVDVLKNRAEELEKKFLQRRRSSYASAGLGRSREGEEEDEESSSLTDFISSYGSYTQGSGLVTHNLNLKSAYDYSLYRDDNPYSKQVTCFLERNCNTVDYILYSNSSATRVGRLGSGVDPESHPPLSSSDLHLLRRFKLFTESEIKSHYSCIPNADLGSDHIILMSEFAAKL